VVCGNYIYYLVSIFYFCAGTRALLNFIGVHPNVTTAGAEVHFFDKYYDKGFEWYRLVFLFFF
jgi:hypothetical protein